MAEMKSCPFCGGEAEISTNTRIIKGKHHPIYWVKCCECGAKVPRYNRTAEEAIDIWNRRASDGKESNH